MIIRRRYALFLVRDLMDLDPPLTIGLLVPVYLATSGQQELAENLIKGWNLPLIPLDEKTTVPALTLSHELPRRMRERIERGAEGECRGLRLLALTSHLKADGLVTALPSLVEARYQLSRHHRLRIIPPSEFPDFVEICARGHDIPCGVTNCNPHDLARLLCLGAERRGEEATPHTDDECPPVYH